LEGSNSRDRISTLRDDLFRYERITYNRTDIRKKPIYLWNKEWINAFESPWSLLSKFQHVNFLSIREVLQIFETSIIGSLYTLKSLNDDLIEKILSYPLKIINNTLLSKLLFPYKDKIQVTDFMSRFLRFCPICIEKMYHSTLHQFLFIKECPFHKVMLLNNCPNCNIEIPYSFSDNIFVSPYTCRCRFKFSQKKIPKKESFTIKDMSLLSWLDTRKDSKKNKPIIITLHENNSRNIDYDEKHFQYTLKDLFNIDNNLYVIHNKKNVDTVKLSTKKIIYKLKTYGRYSSIEQMYSWRNQNIFILDLYLSSNQIMNSIARNLRKTILSKHKKCIKSCSTNLLETSPDMICPFALAYVLWRKRLQSFRAINYVDNGGKTPFNGSHYSTYGFP